MDLEEQPIQSSSRQVEREPRRGLAILTMTLWAIPFIAVAVFVAGFNLIFSYESGLFCDVMHALLFVVQPLIYIGLWIYWIYRIKSVQSRVLWASHALAIATWHAVAVLALKQSLDSAFAGL